MSPESKICFLSAFLRSEDRFPAAFRQILIRFVLRLTDLSIILQVNLLSESFFCPKASQLVFGLASHSSDRRIPVCLTSDRATLPIIPLRAFFLLFSFAEANPDGSFLNHPYTFLTAFFPSGDDFQAVFRYTGCLLIPASVKLQLVFVNRFNLLRGESKQALFSSLQMNLQPFPVGLNAFRLPCGQPVGFSVRHTLGLTLLWFTSVPKL